MSESILEWKAVSVGSESERVFERPDFYRCKPKRIAAKHPGVFRICLFGESMAAGFPLAPAYTPAIALEDRLRASAPFKSHEVIDLAMPNMGPSEQLRVCESAQSLNPDACVFMGGNNWYYGLSVEPTASPDARASYARVLADEGAAGLARAFRRALESRAAVVVRTMAETARSVGAVPIIVIPPSNHAWERRNTPPWQSDHKARAWFESWFRAEAALAAGDWTTAIAIAQTMTAIDESLTGTPERILAKAYASLGQFDEARDAAMRAIDASNWHNYSWALPQTPAYVADVMRATARSLECRCVDLEAVFRAHTGSAYIDFRMFYDQCHLSIEGIQVAMSAVASTMAEAGAAFAIDSRVEPAPAIAASAAFQGAHWISQYHAQFDAGSLDATLRHALRKILALDPSFAETLNDQIRLKSIACSPALNGVLPDAMRLPGVAAPLLSTRLNAPFFSAIVSVLSETNAKRDDVAPLVDHVIATYEAALANGLDVAQVPFRAAFWERTPLAWNDPTERQGSPFYRAPWPISEFDFMADGAHSIDFDLIARSTPAARDGRVSVAVNGAWVADFELVVGWKHLRGRIPRSALRRAANRIRVSWSSLLDDEANAIASAKERFAAGANGELFPVFGEIFSFDLRSVNA